MRQINWPAVIAVLLTLGALIATLAGALSYVPVLGVAAIVSAVLSLRQE